MKEATILYCDESNLWVMKGTYGERLKNALVISGKSRRELAAELKISVQAIGQTINGGTTAFTAENHERAVRFLRVNGYWLATGEGNPQIQSLEWPFPSIDKNRYSQLTEAQRKAIEEWVAAQLDAFLGKDPSSQIISA